jgi:parallel beta-helix repeat protein
LIVGAGIGVQVGGHGTVDNNVIVGPCDTGMWLQNAAAYRVTNNLVWGCTSPGIDLEGGAVSGRASVVSGNTIGGCRFGVDLVAIGRPAVIRSNRFYANDYGFYDSASAASDITRNGFWNNVTAITGLVSGDRITKNKLYASSNGIVLSATHVVVSHNAISGSGNSGLVLNDAAIGDRILSNVIFSGAAAGLVESHGGNTVKSNRIFENAHDGMYVQTSSGSLRNNLLVSNGWLNGVPSGTSDFGIEVAAGVTPPPSHHNRAHRNASGTPQCLPATVCS